MTLKGPEAEIFIMMTLSPDLSMKGIIQTIILKS
jgi:hypothetical protein